MASRSRLLHLPFKDPDGNNGDGHVLLRVSPASDDEKSSSSSSSPLDLDLLATQGTEAFVTTLQHSRVSRYRDEKSCSEQEWENHLISLLVDSHPIGDLDVLAESNESGHLTIDVRKVSPTGRAQRLGTLRLRRSFKAAENADIFGWCVEQIIARSQLEKDLEDLRRKHTELEKLVAEETAHFQKLERGKREFEALHDSFCRDLINEKKLKIRTLEKVLSTAQVDQETISRAGAAAVSTSASSSSKHRTASTETAGATRKGKRKAEGPTVDVHGSDDETDNDIDKMDVDESDRNVGMTTPETASESEPELKPELKPKPKLKGKPRSSPRRNKKATSQSDSEYDAEPEPSRRLPVNKKTAQVPDPADDESTASE